MKYSNSIFALPGLVGLAYGHGFVTSPQARMPGTAMTAACGEQVEVNQSSDNYGNIQGELQVASSQSDYNAAECDIWLCKGYKYADNTANVQSYTAGQTIPMTVDIRAPHTGVANVSIVDTASNSVIGSPLISWSVYASTATGVTANETSFSITMPTDLGSQCSTAGDCVIQWYWYAESIDQTYESCVDFTVGGSSSGSSSAASSAVASTSAATSTTVATSSAQVAAVQATSTTLATSVVASSTPTSTTAASAASSYAAVISAMASAFPSGALTSVIPSTPTATASGVVIPDKALPAGTTLEDLLSWFTYVVTSLTSSESSSSSSVTRRHARDVAGRV